MMARRSPSTNYASSTRKTAIVSWALLVNPKQFADRQRALRKAGKLLKERETLLNEIGFPWNPHDEIWKEMLEQLCESIKTGTPPDKRLLSWMRNQRTKVANGLLSEDRIKRLNDVGFYWNLSRIASITSQLLESGQKFRPD
jgi:Helicase associated domain